MENILERWIWLRINNTLAMKQSNVEEEKNYRSQKKTTMGNKFRDKLCVSGLRLTGYDAMMVADYSVYMR